MRKSFALALTLLAACSFDLSRSPSSDRSGDLRADLGQDGPRAERPGDARGDQRQPPPPSETICSANGWCWENPLPQGGTLHAVAVREGSQEVWAVGEGGVVLRSLDAGKKWAGWGAAGGVSRTLRGVWAAPAPSQEVIAVGDGGTILRHDGSAWTKIAAPVGDVALNAVFGANGVVVAVGEAGTILSYDGKAWVSESSSTTGALRGVWGTGSVFFVVGDPVAAGGAATILKRDQGKWTAKSSPVGALWAVWGLQESDTVFAAGRVEPYGEIFVSTDGGNTWNAMGPPAKPLMFHGIWASSAGNLFAAADDGKIYRYTGTWSSTPLTVNEANALMAVTGFPSGIALSVGAGGVIARFDGKTWAEASQVVTRADLRGVWGLGDGTRVYAVGEKGSDGQLLQRDTSWRPLGTYGVRLQDVWGASTGDDIYVVGAGGTILRYLPAASSWPPEIVPNNTPDLTAVSGTPDGKEVYAVGAKGTALVRTNGSWSLVGGGSVQGQPSLTGVFAAGAGELWATDGTANLWRWSPGPQGSWKQEPTPASALHGIWGAAGQIRSVGDRIVVRDSKDWKQEASSPVGNLLRAWGDGTILVAVGGRGPALSGIAIRQATGAWQAMSAGTGATLRGVWGTTLPSGRSLFYAVGPAGAILRREQ